MLHYSFMNYSQVLKKMDHYSSASAEQAFAKGKQSSPLKAMLHGLWSFVRTYFIRRGFLDGAQGYALAVSNAQGTYYRYIKLWQLNQDALKAKIGISEKSGS
jgi:hypothetical protein